MVTTAELAIIIRAQAQQARAGLAGVQGRLEHMGAAAMKAGAALSAAVTLPLIGLGVASAKAASDLEEARNAMAVTFGQSAAIVEAFVEKEAARFNLSKRAA